MSRKKSVASRLFLWLFFVALVALLIAGGVLYIEVRTILLAAMDHDLESDVEIFSGLLHEEGGELEFEYAEVALGNFIIPRSGHYYEVFVDGELFAFSPSLAGEDLNPSLEQLEYEDPGQNLRVFTAIGPAREPIRVMERTAIFAGHPTRVVVAHSLEENRQMLHRFRLFLLALGAAAILLIALAGLLISHRSLRPLREFSATVRRITERTLDQRMPSEKQYREFSILAAAFNEMLDRLQKSLAAREELLSDVSHELKTPVTVIRSHCDIYLQKERPTAEYVEALEVIRETADVMGLKIRRLLSTSQIEANLIASGGFHLLCLDECLRKARLTVEPLARNRGIVLSEQIMLGLKVLGHEERLIEAFSNLLENAVKYNRELGTVNIVARREGDRAQVLIEDTGRGIDPKEAARIFERFYRGTGASELEGTGLGLGIVKAIIEAHAGGIEVDSRPGEGSCFTVTLPLAGG